jgi:hypothetical protein
MYLGDYAQESWMGKNLQPPHVVTIVQSKIRYNFSKNIIPSVLPWVVELAIVYIKLSYKVYVWSKCINCEIFQHL